MSSKYTTARRWRLIRSVLVFQIKLIVDGFRDFLLVPVSMVAGIVDLVQGNSAHKGNFRDVMVWGRRSERWIDLFGPVQHTDIPEDEGRFDGLVDQLERTLKDQVRKGGVTATAKNSIDKLLDQLQNESLSPVQLFWSERYASGETRWDRGEASPALVEWDLTEELKGQRVLIPGCGRGWEVDELAAAGADVIAVDVVEVVLDSLHERLEENALEAELLLEDVLALELEDPVDAIYEQTCLCALDPDDRVAYESKLHRWLKPGGRLYALFMQTDGKPGPPWHCDLDDMRDLFPEDRWEWQESEPLGIDHPAGLTELGVILTRR